ncbi:MAG: GGDEF domain-containing protein [Haloechinothrix sp.]
MPTPGVLAAPTTFPADLVDLHESIGKLLAAQGEWERAYFHLGAALRIARDHECGTWRVPEQYRREVDALRQAHARALDESLRDSLTATYNRRYLDQQLVALLAEQCHTGAGVAVALVDLDLFKRVNDTYGHLLGDRVLQRVVALLQADLPEGAFCARYGGEEFVLVLPDVDARTAVTTVERARARVAHHPWSTLAPDLQVTISVGLVHHAAEDRPLATRADAERQLRRADDLLYSAKRAGRNAVAYRTNGAIRIAGLDDNCR